MRTLRLLPFLLVFLSFKAICQQVIPLNDSMIYNISIKGDPTLLIDEPCDPKNGTSTTPTTYYHPGYNPIYLPGQVIFDLGANYKLDEFWFYDINSIDTLRIYTGTPAKWKLSQEIITTKYLSWDSVLLNDSTRFLMLYFHTSNAKISEMVLYGQKLSDVNISLPPTIDHPLPTMDQFIGINIMHDNPDSLLTPFGAVREYHSWQWDEGVRDSTYPGYPNNDYAWNPSFIGRNDFDAAYLRKKKAGIDMNPCLQMTPPHLRYRNDKNTKPIAPIENPEEPQSYIEHADYLFQFAARYGRNKVAPDLLKIKSGTKVASGLDLVYYMENWNEPDKWWAGRDAYFSPFEMAAMSSADYDGHEGRLGTTVGIKNADSTMKMALGGSTQLDIEYIRAMKLWSDHHRTSGFPADVLNFHTYSNTAGGQNGIALKGISPEDDSLKQKLKKIVAYRDKYLPGKEIWLSEFGYSTHPGSPQRASAIGPNDAYEVQAQWNLRSYLEIAAAKLDRAHLFLLEDQPSESSGKFSTCGIVKDRRVNTPTDTIHDHAPYEKKKSWYYIFCMKNALHNLYFHQEINSGVPHINVYEFRNGKQDTSVFAVWCNTSNNTIDSNYLLPIGEAYNCTQITPVHFSETGKDSVLTIQNNQVKLTVTERPVFIRKILRDTIAPEAIAKSTTLYLNKDGEAQLLPEMINHNSTDNYAIVSMQAVPNSFNCNDISAGFSKHIKSDSSWKKSTVTHTATAITFPWVGAPALPAKTTFNLPAEIGQPHSWHSVDPVPGTAVIKTSSYVTFFRKTFSIPHSQNISGHFKMTVDDDMEIFINGKLIAGEYNFQSSNRLLPYHSLSVATNHQTSNGTNNQQPFDSVANINLSSILHAGENEIVLAIRNGGPGNIGGFSFSLELFSSGIPVQLIVKDNNNNSDTAFTWVNVLDTLLPQVITKDIEVTLDSTGQIKIDAQDINNGTKDNCATIQQLSISDSIFNCSHVVQKGFIVIRSDSSWKKSTEINQTDYYQNPWGGVQTLPDKSTFTTSVELGQPYSYNSIATIGTSQVIKTGSFITFFRKTFQLNGHTDFEAQLKLTVDDNVEVYLNGHLIARELNYSSTNRTSPPHHLHFPTDEAPVNGYQNGDSFDHITSSSISSWLKNGENEIILAVRNGGTGNLGGFCFELKIGATPSTPITLTATDSKNETNSGIAFVTVRDNGTCAPSGNMKKQNEATSSIHEATPQYRVYPNPTPSKLFIQVPDEQSFSISLIDVNGKLVHANRIQALSENNTIELQLKEINRGFYFLHLQLPDSTIVYKIIKQ